MKKFVALLMAKNEWENDTLILSYACSKAPEKTCTIIAPKGRECL